MLIYTLQRDNQTTSPSISLTSKIKPLSNHQEAEMPEMFLSPCSRVLARGQSVFIPVSGRGQIVDFISRQYLIAFESGLSAWVNPLHEEIIPC